VFTGLLLADLAEHDLVGLDDPLGSHLPASVQVPTFEAYQVTLADLASQLLGCRGPPWARWAGGCVTRTTPTPSSRPRSCMQAWH
jgi:CubicO group peptidase (beta-lactamase class C family)